MTAESWPKCKSCKRDRWFGMAALSQEVTWGCSYCGTTVKERPVEQLELLPEEPSA